MYNIETMTMNAFRFACFLPYGLCSCVCACEAVCVSLFVGGSGRFLRDVHRWVCVGTCTSTVWRSDTRTRTHIECVRLVLVCLWLCFRFAICVRYCRMCIISSIESRLRLSTNQLDENSELVCGITQTRTFVHWALDIGHHWWTNNWHIDKMREC